MDIVTERFWNKVEFQKNGCWVWTGYIKPDIGYGVKYIKHKNLSILIGILLKYILVPFHLDSVFVINVTIGLV